MRFPRARLWVPVGIAVFSGLGVLGMLRLNGALGWSEGAQYVLAAAAAVTAGGGSVAAHRVFTQFQRLRRAVEEYAKARRKDRARLNAAIRRARGLFETGHIQEAINEVTVYAASNETAARLRRRYEGERLALGPMGPLPPRDTANSEAVPGRVLHFVSNALPVTQAGYTVRTHGIAVAQRGIGLDPHVVTFAGWPPPEAEDTASEIVVDGVTYHRLHPGESLPEGLQTRVETTVEAAIELARRLRPAVLHAASDHRNATVALAVGATLDIPVVYEMRGFLEETWLSKVGARAYGTERHRMLVERESSVARAADAVITLSETMREEILDRGVPTEDVVLAPNAVDAALLDTPPDGGGFRAAHGIGTEEFVVGSVSSLVGYEGFHVLLDAAAMLRERGEQVRVLLVGDGTERSALMERAVERGLGDSCVFPGRVGPDEALCAQAALDALVVPRVDVRVCRLVTPLKPVEAMALGTPVVASNLPALRELLSHGRAGLMVPPGDVEALVKALSRLRADEGLREELVAAGRKEVTARRTWPRIAEIDRDLYVRLGVPVLEDTGWPR